MASVADASSTPSTAATCNRPCLNHIPRLNHVEGIGHKLIRQVIDRPPVKHGHLGLRYAVQGAAATVA
jgi:hypothetical protein